MTASPLSPRDLLDVLALGRRVAFELADEATDQSKPLTMAARRALADLAVAVDAAVSARVGAAPLGPEASDELTRALDELEAKQRRQPPP